MLSKKIKNFKVDDRIKHIAFIMDGNGRWAKKRALSRNFGHKQGAKALEIQGTQLYAVNITIIET